MINSVRSFMYSTTITSWPGEIPWKHFLRAKSSTALIEQRMYRPIWQSRPTAIDVERSILFHEPHLHPKLFITIARRSGRKLIPVYGRDGKCCFQGESYVIWLEMET